VRNKPVLFSYPIDFFNIELVICFIRIEEICERLIVIKLKPTIRQTEAIFLKWLQIVSAPNRYAHQENNHQLAGGGGR
ncbi:MAG: hypothetical protein ACKOC0_04365, partial [Cytophagales bacterium]